MTELEDDFDFVDQKVDRGERVKPFSLERTTDRLPDFSDDLDSLILTNAVNGAYVIYDEGNMALHDFLSDQYYNGAFVKIKIKDGKIID